MVLGLYHKTGKTITLNDKSGNDALVVKDSDGFNVIRLTSQGNIEHKGQITRTVTN